MRVICSAFLKLIFSVNIRWLFMAESVFNLPSGAILLFFNLKLKLHKLVLLSLSTYIHLRLAHTGVVYQR